MIDNFQPRAQTAVHLVASRQTGTATAILRALLTISGRDIRVTKDSVSFKLNFIFLSIEIEMF